VKQDAHKAELTARTAVRTEVITAADAGRRLDNVLMNLIKHAPKGLIYKLLRSGQVRVNSGRAKPDYRVIEGDRVRVPPVIPNSAERDTVPPSRLEQLRGAIVHEDAHLIVVNKPSGLACHGGTGLSYGVIEVMRALRPELTRLDLAHRLDRETSGCLVLTKDLGTLQAFHGALRERETCKQYVALLRGHVPDDLMRIDAHLNTRRNEHGERRAEVEEGGKAAATVVEQRRRYGANTLVRLRLETGRMHQIRAHARYIGHPIAGDREYGDAKFNREMKRHGLRRLFLHAERIAVTASTSSVDVVVPPGPDLEAVLESIERAAS
jgi:23S rRNA pseudouridine955/2504/2580 synthase